jgi:cell division septal protein FtsQ
MELNKEQIKEKIRSKTKSVLILLGISVVLVMIAFISNYWFSKQTIRTIKITGNKVLSNGEINSIIDKQIMNVENDGLDLSAIKYNLLSNEYILNANVWVNSKGVLGIDIEERNPIAIIISSDGTPNFIDKYGKSFSYKLYKNFIDIPVVRNIELEQENTLKNKDVILILMTLKEKYSLLNTRVSEILYNKKSNEYSLCLTCGDICVNIGNVDNLENKLNVIQFFMNNIVLVSVDMSVYKNLDARWANKIIVN